LVLAAITENRLPQMLLVTGPQGVGKQRFGLWLGQAVLCQSEANRPCGACQSCLQVEQLTYPDLHWFVPVVRPKATEPGKQIEELAESLGEVIAERRKSSCYPPADGLQGHFVATARLLQRQASLTPAAGKKKVFLIGAADRLVPQESSQEAANALLKLLEEPPADSQFILTTVDATRLLPTIRSRLVPLRLGRLGDNDVRGFLSRYAGLSGNALEQQVREARGSIGRGLATGNDGGKARPAADELLAALVTGAASRAERALKQGPWAARGDFTAMLDALAEQLGEAARLAAGVPGRQHLPDALRRPRSVASLVRAVDRIQAARDSAQGNVNPQLLLMALSDDLAEVL
jgi:DNA polymerase-3 subunit delta'